MTLRRVPIAFLAVVLLAALLLAGRTSVPAAASVATTSPGHLERALVAAQPKVVYFNLGHATVKPRRMHTAYSSSPYLKKLQWKRWGGRSAVATGIWMSDCASCPPPARREAVVRLSKRVTCENVDYRTYERAIVTVAEPNEGSTDTTYKLPTGCALAIED